MASDLPGMFKEVADFIENCRIMASDMEMRHFEKRAVEADATLRRIAEAWPDEWVCEGLPMNPTMRRAILEALNGK